MGTIKISIRRKSLQGSFTSIFLENFPISSKKIFIPRYFGILTACSHNLFIGLQILLSSIIVKYDVKILVYDVGMTPEQIAWCKKHPGVMVKAFRLRAMSNHIKYSGAWFKSHYIRSSPFKNTIWIDADTAVMGDLYELIELSRPNALFTEDHTYFQASTLNHPNLYSYLPLGKPSYHDILPYLNTGVLVVQGKRDAKVLDDWCYCVEQACSVREIAEAIACWDQGACKWALHRNDKLCLIIPDKKFNYPAKIRHHSYPSTEEAVKYWINSMRSEESCVVLHWMGSPKPWNRWGDMIDLDISNLAR